jgi:hypothetical protein
MKFKTISILTLIASAVCSALTSEASQLYTNQATGQVYTLTPVPTPGALSTNAPIVLPTPVATVETNPPTSILGLLQSYLLQNDPTWNGWQSNHVCIWQAAVFSSVNGTPGASAIGNDLGAEFPIHKYNIHIESITRFEQLFGDVHSQAVGVGYDYNIHQIQLSAGVDVEDTFANNAVRAVPFLEFKKASTSMAGLSPFFRYEFPVQKNPGAGRVLVGMQLPL